ncbi:MAG: ABC transporter permease [Candidatus Melainabacteria bacterium]|jgi:peptide/nickel transport system permease protein|nr:ABC transporter permease [Candidatus Melainabacteria bacterium]
MLTFLLKRLIGSIFLVLFISFMTFSLMKINFTVPELKIDLQIPYTEIHLFKFYSAETQVQTGDPLADLKLNPEISESRIEAEAKRLGLDKSFIEQYFTWLSNVLRGDFGFSQNNLPVIDLIAPALFNTLILNIFAIIFTWGIAIPLGVFAAVNRGTWMDSSLRFLLSVFMSVPGFVLAIFMLLFALSSGWFPIGGLTSSFYDELSPLGQFWDLLRHLFLPVFILVIGGIVGLQRQMRGNLLDVLREDYIRTARAKGLPENKVIYKHALRNAMNPLITILGYEFSSLFGGSALIEMVLAFPGLGYLTLEAARKLDINVVLANLLLGSLMLVLGNLLADVLLMKMDPRMRASQLN